MFVVKDSTGNRRVVLLPRDFRLEGRVKRHGDLVAWDTLRLDVCENDLLMNAKAVRIVQEDPVKGTCNNGAQPCCCSR